MDIKSENTSDINKKSENPETFMSRFSVVTYINHITLRLNFLKKYLFYKIKICLII